MGKSDGRPRNTTATNTEKGLNMINAKDEIRAARLSNIGHTISLINDAHNLQSQAAQKTRTKINAVIATLVGDLEKQSKALEADA